MTIKAQIALDINFIDDVLGKQVKITNVGINTRLRDEIGKTMDMLCQTGVLSHLIDVANAAADALNAPDITIVDELEIQKQKEFNALIKDAPPEVQAALKMTLPQNNPGPAV